MKARPRSVENRVAEELTTQLRDLGFGITLKRVPAPGYPWPDLTWPNALHLAVEVKSQVRIPKLPSGAFVTTSGVYFGLPLRDLSTVSAKQVWEAVAFRSKIVDQWMDHLVDTVGQEEKHMLVLHRPGSLITSAVVVMTPPTVGMLYRD